MVSRALGFERDWNPHFTVYPAAQMYVQHAVLRGYAALVGYKQSFREVYGADKQALAYLLARRTSATFGTATIPATYLAGGAAFGPTAALAAARSSPSRRSTCATRSTRPPTPRPTFWLTIAIWLLLRVVRRRPGTGLAARRPDRRVRRGQQVSRRGDSSSASASPTSRRAGARAARCGAPSATCGPTSRCTRRWSPSCARRPTSSSTGTRPSRTSPTSAASCRTASATRSPAGAGRGWSLKVMPRQLRARRSRCCSRPGLVWAVVRPRLGTTVAAGLRAARLRRHGRQPLRLLPLRAGAPAGAGAARGTARRRRRRTALAARLRSGARARSSVAAALLAAAGAVDDPRLEAEPHPGAARHAHRWRASGSRRTSRAAVRSRRAITARRTASRSSRRATSGCRSRTSTTLRAKGVRYVLADTSPLSFYSPGPTAAQLEQLEQRRDAGVRRRSDRPAGAAAGVRHGRRVLRAAAARLEHVASGPAHPHLAHHPLIGRGRVAWRRGHR